MQPTIPMMIRAGKVLRQNVANRVGEVLCVAYASEEFADAQFSDIDNTVYVGKHARKRTLASVLVESEPVLGETPSIEVTIEVYASLVFQTLTGIHQSASIKEAADGAEVSYKIVAVKGEFE